MSESDCEECCLANKEDILSDLDASEVIDLLKCYFWAEKEIAMLFLRDVELDLKKFLREVGVDRIEKCLTQLKEGQ